MILANRLRHGGSSSDSAATAGGAAIGCSGKLQTPPARSVPTEREYGEARTAELEGTVTEVRPTRCSACAPRTAWKCGLRLRQMRKFRIRILAGDRVSLEMSPYDFPRASASVTRTRPRSSQAFAARRLTGRYGDSKSPADVLFLHTRRINHRGHKGTQRKTANSLATKEREGTQVMRFARGLPSCKIASSDSCAEAVRRCDLRGGRRRQGERHFSWRNALRADLERMMGSYHQRFEPHDPREIPRCRSGA